MKRVIALVILTISIVTTLQAADRYMISSVDFSIEGRTRRYFLEKLLGPVVGTELPDQAELDAFIADKLQLLMNERVLESVEIIPGFGTAVTLADDTGTPYTRIPVDLHIKTRDTWNLIGLPYFKYDSNTGILLALRGRDYNFFGTMEPLILNINWAFDNDGNSNPGIATKFSFPFNAAGLDWTWALDAGFETPDLDEIDVTVDTGIKVEIPVGLRSIALFTRQRVDAGDEDSEGIPYLDDYYLTNTVGLSYTLPIPLTPRMGTILIQPGINLAYRWKPDGLVDASLATTPVLTPSISASAGRVDWKGNFRHGIEAEVGIEFPFYLSAGTNATNITWESSLFQDVGFLGVSSRFSGFANLSGSIDSSAGDPVRGVLNSRIKTDAAMFLNLDLPVRLIRFRPSEWFGLSWMRYFNFEQHWSPFLDIALVHAGTRYFDPEDAWLGAGLEIITYPAVSRSFFVRISAAWDFRDVLELRSLTGQSPRDGRGISEFFLGVGHHY